ncbi:MAG: hypothetical protein ACEQR8_04825 [Cypionkella sp.]
MAKAKSFDIAALDTISACNKPAEVEIHHPATGAPTGVFISILGKDSDVFRARMRALADETIAAAAQGPRQDDAERRTVETLAAATTGWRTGDEQVLILSGERLEFSEANARRVYQTILPIREQASAAIYNLDLFMKG